VVTGPFDLAPAVSNLLTGVLGDENTIKALFGDDGKGTAAGTLDRFGLGAVSNEPGNQPGYPASNVNRNMFRISAVFNCTMFGVPVEPDCLLDVIGPRRRDSQAGDERGRTAKDGAEGGATPGAAPDGSPPLTHPAGLPGGDKDGPLGLNDVLDDAPNLPDLGGGGNGGNGGKQGPKGPGQAAQDLLDFLFKP
jgi:hypothetical protein